MLLRSGLFVLVFAPRPRLSQAAPDAVVEGVQLPAWFTRDGKRQPLAVGTELRSSDEVATGGNSRLLLRLGDGSVVKLGENGRLQLADLVQKRKQSFLGGDTAKCSRAPSASPPRAAAKSRGRRDITVQFPTHYRRHPRHRHLGQESRRQGSAGADRRQGHGDPRRRPAGANEATR